MEVYKKRENSTFEVYNKSETEYKINKRVEKEIVYEQQMTDTLCGILSYMGISLKVYRPE